MKLNLLKNDKSTVKDELILSAIVAAFLIIGILLVITKPSFWFVDSGDTLVFGVLMIVAGVMYLPGLIYRFITNDR